MRGHAAGGRDPAVAAAAHLDLRRGHVEHADEIRDARLPLRDGPRGAAVLAHLDPRVLGPIAQRPDRRFARGHGLGDHRQEVVAPDRRRGGSVEVEEFGGGASADGCRRVDDVKDACQSVAQRRPLARGGDAAGDFSVTYQ